MFGKKFRPVMRSLPTSVRLEGSRSEIRKSHAKAAQFLSRAEDIRNDIVQEKRELIQLRTYPPRDSVDFVVNKLLDDLAA